MPLIPENSSSGAYVTGQLIVCKKCNHQWRENILQNVLVKVWTAHVRSLRCLNCGADYHELAFKREPQLPSRKITEEI